MWMSSSVLWLVGDPVWCIGESARLENIATADVLSYNFVLHAYPSSFFLWLSYQERPVHTARL